MTIAPPKKRKCKYLIFNIATWQRQFPLYRRWRSPWYGLSPFKSPSKTQRYDQLRYSKSTEYSYKLSIIYYLYWSSYLWGGFTNEWLPLRIPAQWKRPTSISVDLGLPLRNGFPIHSKSLLIERKDNRMNAEQNNHQGQFFILGNVAIEEPAFY